MMRLILLMTVVIIAENEAEGFRQFPSFQRSHLYRHSGSGRMPHNSRDIEAWTEARQRALLGERYRGITPHLPSMANPDRSTERRNHRDRYHPDSGATRPLPYHTYYRNDRTKGGRHHGRPTQYEAIRNETGEEMTTTPGSTTSGTDSKHKNRSMQTSSRLPYWGNSRRPHEEQERREKLDRLRKERQDRRRAEIEERRAEQERHRQEYERLREEKRRNQEESEGQDRRREDFERRLQDQRRQSQDRRQINDTHRDREESRSDSDSRGHHGRHHRHYDGRHGHHEGRHRHHEGRHRHHSVDFHHHHRHDHNHHHRHHGHHGGSHSADFHHHRRHDHYNHRRRHGHHGGSRGSNSHERSGDRSRMPSSGSREYGRHFHGRDWSGYRHHSFEGMLGSRRPSIPHPFGRYHPFGRGSRSRSSSSSSSSSSSEENDRGRGRNCKKQTEQPSYDVTCVSPDGYEVRVYEEAVWVTTIVNTTSYDDGGSIGFRRLFSYISGENSGNVRINMTKPVRRHMLRRPAEQTNSTSCRRDTSYSMSFFVPRQYWNNTPEPLDDEVFIELASSYVYAYNFSGWTHGKRAQEMYKELYELLEESDQPKVENEYFVQGFDGPWVIHGRHNEVLIPVDPDEGEPTCFGQPSTDEPTQTDEPLPNGIKQCLEHECPTFNESSVLADNIVIRRVDVGVYANKRSTTCNMSAVMGETYRPLREYFLGANAEEVSIPATVPILQLGVRPERGPAGCNFTYQTSFYIPEIYQDAPPTPNDETIFISSTEVTSYYVLIFHENPTPKTAFAKYSELKNFLRESNRCFVPGNFQLAFYDSPFRPLPHRYEVWIPFDDSCRHNDVPDGVEALFPPTEDDNYILPLIMRDDDEFLLPQDTADIEKQKIKSQ